MLGSAHILPMQKPPPTLTQGREAAVGARAFVKILVLTALCPKILPTPQRGSDFAFSSFLSAVNTTSGFQIKGKTLADEFTARCWLLEHKAIDLIQSTRNRRAPAPIPWAEDTT